VGVVCVSLTLSVSVLNVCVVRYESRDQSKSGPSGTEVDVHAIKSLVQQAIHALPT
jgi:hypothetical protein